MSIYDKLNKKILSGKQNLKHGENIALLEECNVVNQRNLPPKLTDPCRLTILCSIGSLTIGHDLCDLGSNINLISLSMMRKSNCGKPKPTQTNLMLVDRSISYPYGVLEDVLVRVNDLLFPVKIVIQDMPEDSKTQLIFRRIFLETCLKQCNTKKETLGVIR